jgi:hypothetical protein
MKNNQIRHEKVNFESFAENFSLFDGKCDKKNKKDFPKT